MYCKHCGKTLSDEAIVCPGCGHPTRQDHPVRRGKSLAEDETQCNFSAIAGFVLSVIAFVMAPFVAAAFFICDNGYTILLSSIALILITLCGFVLGLYAIVHIKTQPTRTKVFSILAVVFTGVVLLLLFVCLLVFIFI